MATPSLTMIPSAIADAKVYSVLPNNGDGDFTFDRASTATRVGQNGLIETVAIDLPRLNYDISNGVVQSCPSLLLEPASTNLFPYSEDFSQSPWVKSKVTITSNSALSPDGTLNASKILETTGSLNGHFILESLGLTENITYNFSVFVKKLNRKYVGLQNSYNSNNGSIAFFDLDNETIIYTFSDGDSGRVFSVSNAKIQSVGNGWLRLSANFQSNVVGDSVVPTLVISNSQWSTGFSYNNPYEGDPTKGVYAWGAQIEALSYATSYIPTLSGAIQTRAVETCLKTGLTNYIGQTEGTLFLEFVSQDASSLQILYQVRSNTGTVGQIDFRLQNGNIIALANDGGSSQFSINGGSYTVGSKYKLAVRYKLNDSKFYINGVSVGNDTSCSFTGSSLNQLSFAENLTSFLPSAKIYDARLFEEPLTDAQLITLTTL